MTPYRMTFYKGKRSYDLTEDTSDEQIPTTTSAEVERSKPYPTPSRSPEASSPQVHLQTHTDQNIRPIKSLPRSHSSEKTSRAIPSATKIKVAVALLIEGKNNLDREKLCRETGLLKQQLADLIRSDGSVWKAMMGAAHSLG